jgi:protein bicaudal C
MRFIRNVLFQQGNLPIALIFDYPEINIDSDTINKLMNAHDVYITSRQKSRQSTMCIVIKGVEKYITNIYDARHQLLKLTSDRIVAAIPSSYYGPNDMANFKNSSIAQLLAGPMTYGPISPIQQIPQITWGNTPEMNTWRSRPPASPLTSSLLHQHNKMTGNLQVPPNMMSRGSISDLHSSGYHSFNDNSTLKNASGCNSSAHSSPENSMNYGNKFAPTMGNFMESPHQQAQRAALNDSLLFNYDPRIVAGIRAMNISPQQGEVRIPTPICKLL